VESLLNRIQVEWKCSAPEVVKEGSWIKFCGFELSKRGDEFLLGQKSYAQDLISRHPGVICKSMPFPGVLDEEPEGEVSIQDVRGAQGIVGELLWLSCRTRPDLSFGVSWMGRMVTIHLVEFAAMGSTCWGTSNPRMTWCFTMVFVKVDMERTQSWHFPGRCWGWKCVLMHPLVQLAVVATKD